MRIAYGVMGYGRGHAMRTSAVLPALSEKHEVTVFAGGDAHAAMAADWNVVKIPTIAWQYSGSGRIASLPTLRHNAGPVADLLFGGPATRHMQAEFRRRQIDLVISDSEAWTHRCAQAMGIPRISFDHVGIIAYCNPPLPAADWLNGHRDAVGYRSLMGVPERILVSSFYPAIPRYPGVELCGPVLRDAVFACPARHGEHLMAYFNKGDRQFLPPVEQALRGLPRPVLVYGTSRRGVSGNLDFRPPGRESFIRDLASCHALICTAGNQLISEALYFEKPLYLLPEDCFEQRLNAFMVRRMGVGQQGEMRTVSSELIGRFLEDHAAYRERLRGQFRDGRADAARHLERYIGELSGRGLRQPTGALQSRFLGAVS